jgi:type IV pilus assembly protein PilA
MQPLRKPTTASGGFSLVELTVVVVILGVLAMVGVPKYRTVVERAKSAEAFTYLAHIEGAQERYNATKGKYAKRMGQLDVKVPRPEHFRVGRFSSVDWQTQWELKLTRSQKSSGFGHYRVTWNQDGFQPARSSIHQDLIPVN